MTGLAVVLVPPISRRKLVRMPLITAAISCLAASAGVHLLTSRTPVAGIVTVTMLFGITLSTTSIGNQTALYTQVTASQIGTAAGLLRSFGYLGSIAASATIAVVFRTHVDDHGLHVLSWVMVAVGAAGLLALLTDRSILCQGSGPRPLRPPS
jgi:sugar phosphate permease